MGDKRDFSIAKNLRPQLEKLVNSVSQKVESYAIHVLNSEIT